MLTISTQAAIAVLQDIRSNNCSYSNNYLLTKEELRILLQRLEAANLIHPLQEGTTAPESLSDNTLLGYELCHPFYELTLLQVLQALDEPVNLNHPVSEEFYQDHGSLAQHLGVINHVARTFLADLKISDW